MLLGIKDLFSKQLILVCVHNIHVIFLNNIINCQLMLIENDKSTVSNFYEFLPTSVPSRDDKKHPV